MLKNFGSIDVAVLMLNIKDLSGGGGAERFFSDVYNHKCRQKNTTVRISFICDEITHKSISATGRHLPDDNLLIIKGKNYFHLKSLFYCLYLAIVKKINVIHIPLIAPVYLPFLWLINIIPVRNKSKITMTQVDCGYAHTKNKKLMDVTQHQRKVNLLHRIYFNTVKLSGILTWYKKFEAEINTDKIYGKPIVRSINSYFVDDNEFKPSSQKVKKIIWAGRQIPSKRPFIFIEAVRNAVALEPVLFHGWSFEMYGAGELRKSLVDYVKLLRLEKHIHFRESSEMKNVYKYSSVFCSTQAYENFTSLSMLEAMSCGNAIISFNVGQTDSFVKHGINGLLVDDLNIEALTDAFISLARDKKYMNELAKSSRLLVETKHTAVRFITELDAFFLDVAQQ